MRLLSLHPLSLDGSIFTDGIRALADASVAPTLYGAGDDITSWAEAALDAVGDGPIVVVGNSIGGSCAIEVARLAPTKVKALVLCGTKPAHRPEPETRDAALQLLAGAGLAAAWERYWLPLFGPNASAEVIEHAWRIASAHGVGALAGLLDVVAESTFDGNKRAMKLADGREVSEIILGIDDQLRRVAFTITASPFPIEAHAASMQVLDADDGKSGFRWICDVTPDEMADRMGQMMAGEIEQLKATFGT